jgi:hypothetical protein
VAHFAAFAKLLIMLPLGVLVAVLILCLAPFALAYFLFDRLCNLIEYFRPQRKVKGRGDKLARIQKFLSFIPLKNAPNDKKGG